MVSGGRMWLHYVRCPFLCYHRPSHFRGDYLSSCSTLSRDSLTGHQSLLCILKRVSWTLAIWSSLLGIKSRLKSKLAENSKIYEKAAFWLCELFRDSTLPLSPYILQECGKRLLQCVKSGGERCFCPVHSSEWTVKPL